MLNLKLALGLAILQAAAPVIPALPEVTPLLQMGVGGLIAVLLFRRYELLALDFRKIVTENTASNTRLGDLIERFLGGDRPSRA